MFKLGILGLSLAAALSSSPAMAAQDVRNLEGFTSISSEGFVDVEVQIGSSYSVIVETDANLFQYVETEVSRGELTIDTKRRSWRHFDDADATVRVLVTMPALEGFQISGSGDAIIAGLDSDEVEFEIRGSGDIDVSGRCGSGEISIRGSGDMDGEDLSCESLYVSVGGSGDTRLTVKNDLKVAIGGSGNVTLTGTCTNAEFRVGGSGDIQARDLVCQGAELTSHGSGDIAVTVNGDVIAELRGSGDIDIFGDASLRRLRSSGSGDIELRSGM